MSDLEHDAYVYPGQRIARNGHVLGHGQGMTLRDWFAGQFLAGAAVGNDPLDRKDGESLEAARARYWGGVAAVAYSAADAMIAARKGGDTHNPPHGGA